MMIYGIGIDVVEVDRIEAAIEKQGELFLRKLFTQKEQEYCSRQKRPALHFAARFAAKEAVSKALGTGIGGQAGWLEIEVIRGESGAPTMFFHGNAADFLTAEGIASVQVSLSHARDYAAANAVAIRNPV
ncbi:holo-ACP synthase [Luteolibacter algae]|uniref:Holo-[acyl-carrier-protein] synthase n=1 Tax=Luteolibacter algae TaxID=454151 RepID=A0ABW5D5W7_9BACT